MLELPPSITDIVYTNCTSLKTLFILQAVSSLNKKYFSFKNCLRLEEHSLCDIMKDAHVTTVRAVIKNLLVRRTHLSKKWRLGEFDSANVCYPGNKVPEWFRY